MPDCHEETLQSEAIAWQAVTDLALRQRQALLGREAQQVEALREALQAQLSAALAARQLSLESRRDPPEAPHTRLRRQADEALRNAHEALRLNLDLLRDTCSYLQMLGSALRADPAPTGYGRERPARAALSARSRVA